jgi:hypothetical protein
MSDMPQAAERSYEISDAWLETAGNKKDKSIFIDLNDICAGRTSQYITDNALDADDESRKARFNHTGIFVDGTVDTDGEFTVCGCLVGETDMAPKVWSLAANVVHPLRFTRIYPWYTNAKHTQARGIKIVGWGTSLTH